MKEKKKSSERQLAATESGRAVAIYGNWQKNRRSEWGKVIPVPMLAD